MNLRIGRVQLRYRLAGLACRVLGHKEDEARLHRLRVGNVTTHRYEVVRCTRCTRVLRASQIGRKTGALRGIDVRKEKP